mmetsp:Transcript_5650/g.21278  ORF Transcript_5650/g.21278 Transcript_5650/m.21278 type:complete len:755 (-) Transcript_5650:1421-3685(-)
MVRKPSKSSGKTFSSTQLQSSPFQIKSFSSSRNSTSNSLHDQSPKKVLHFGDDTGSNTMQASPQLTSSKKQKRTSSTPMYRPNSAPSTNVGTSLEESHRRKAAAVSHYNDIVNTHEDSPTSKTNKSPQRVKSSNGRRASDFIHRFRNAPAMSREERRRQKLRLHREQQMSDRKAARNDVDPTVAAFNQQGSSDHFVLASGLNAKSSSSSSPEKRPKSSSATQRGYSPHYRHFQHKSPSAAANAEHLFRKKSPYLHKAMSPSSSKRSKRRKSDSSVLHLNGRGVNNTTTATSTTDAQSHHQSNDLTPKKRRSIDHFRRRSEDQSLTMSMIKNNLRENIVTDPNIKPDYNKIKKDVKKMFGDVDTSLSPSSPPSASSKSPKKRPKSSISYRGTTSSSESGNNRGKSPLGFRRYSSPTAGEAPRASTDKLPETFTPKRMHRSAGSVEKRNTPKRTQSPSLRRLNTSVSPSSNHPLRRRSTPESHSPSTSKRSSIDELNLASRPLSQGSTGGTPGTPNSQRSKSASGIRSSKRARRRLSLQDEEGSTEKELGTVSLPSNSTKDSLHSSAEHSTRSVDSMGKSRDDQSSHTSATATSLRRHSSKDGSDSRDNQLSRLNAQPHSTSLSEKNHTRPSSIGSRHTQRSHANPSHDEPATLHPLPDQKPITTMHLQENDPQFLQVLREHTSDTLNYVFSNMKLKTFFKFTIEEAPVYERPKIKTKHGRSKKSHPSYNDSLKDDPLLNVLQKRVEMVREKIGKM